MMTGVFLRVAAVSIGVSVLLLPLLLGRRWLERRYAPQTRWGLWLAVTLVLLAAPMLPRGKAPVVVRVTDHVLTVPAPAEWRGQGGGERDARPVTAPARPQGEPGTAPAGEVPQAPAGRTEKIETAHGSIEVYYPTEEELAALEKRRGEAAGNTISLTDLAARVWLAGMVLLALWQWGRYGYVRRRLLKKARPARGWEGLAREICPERQVGFYTCPGLPGPMTLGVFRPAVLLPEEGTAPAAVRHELYHVRRWDVGYKVLVLCGCILHWFNPLVWRVAGAADRDVEACCDAAVVDHRDSEYKRAYGELLLTAAAGRAAPFATHFGSGKEEMRSRLSQLFRPGKKSRALVCGLLAGTMLLSSLVACREKGDGMADGTYCALGQMVSYPVGAADGEGENYEALRLRLRRYEEESPQGEVMGECIIDLAAGLTLREDRWDPGEKGTEEWQKKVAEFLAWPQRRNSIPLGQNYLVLEVKDDEIVHMAWTEVPMGDSLYVSDRYGFALQLPEDWSGRYAVEEGRDEFGTRWRFYEKQSHEAEPGAGLLFTLDRASEVSIGNYPEEGYELSSYSSALGVREGWLYTIGLAPDAGAAEGFEEDYQQMKGEMGAITAEKLTFLTEGEEAYRKPIMPTLDYYDRERGFLVYHTATSVTFHHGDTYRKSAVDETEAGRYIGRVEISEDGKWVYFTEVSDMKGAEVRYYSYDVEGRLLTRVDTIPEGRAWVTQVSQEELFYSGFMNGTSLLSNVIRTEDGSLVGLFIDEQAGNSMEFLRLCGMTNGSYWPEMPFLTPERIPGGLSYVDYNWNFVLHLPEAMYDKYVVNKAGNFWGFYDKAAYGFGRGYLMGLWAEDSSTFRPGEETLVLGAKEGITYSLTFGDPWDGDGLPREELKENYRALLAAVKTIRPENFALSGVERTGGELWPLPYTQYGSDVVLRGYEEGIHEAIDIRATDEVTVQCMWNGVVVDVDTDPATGWQTVTVDHENGTFSQYSHLAAVYVTEGPVEREAILGLAGEENGRRWVTFRRMDGESWETARSFDPLGSEEEPWSYRTYDYRSIDRQDLTLVGDPAVEELLRAAAEGKTAFYDVERRKYCYANALPCSDGVEVTVNRYAWVDMDNDTVPEVVLWLNRGENPYVMGSIVLHYRKGMVQGYPMGFRSMNLLTLRRDGTFDFAGSAFDWGWGRMDFSTGEIKKISWCTGKGTPEGEYHVNGGSVSQEAFDRVAEAWEAGERAVWYERSGNCVFDLQAGGRLLTVRLLTGEAPESDYFAVRKIQVYEGDKLIQSIDADELEQPKQAEGYLWEGLFVNRGYEVGEPEVKDLNFDGNEDFGILAADGYPHNVPYSYFLWNEEKGAFEHRFVLFCGVEADGSRRELVETEYSTNPGGGGTVWNRYAFDGDGGLRRLAVTRD